MGHMFTKEVIDSLVQKIAKRQTKPIIDASIDNMADEIEGITGVRPSKNTIWLSLKRIGAVASGRKFVYRHNEESHE